MGGLFSSLPQRCILALGPHPALFPITGLQVGFAVLGFGTGMGPQCTLPGVAGQAASLISLVGLCEA